MEKMFLATLALAALGMSARAAIHTETVTYRQGETELRGYLAYDDAVIAKRPGVLVCPEWWGLNDYPRRRAEQLAKLGYVALATDLYGGGKVAQDAKQAGEWATALKGDRALLRARAMAGLETLRALPQVDPEKLAAIGYCFGGTTVLELARAGAPLKGVVSFHGNLDTPHPDQDRIKAAILVCHGADDPNVPPAQVQAFIEEMRGAKADYQIVSYGGAVHSFTNPASGNDPTKGAAYNEKADKRSWKAMRAFFKEIFGER